MRELHGRGCCVAPPPHFGNAGSLSNETRLVSQGLGRSSSSSFFHAPTSWPQARTEPPSLACPDLAEKTPGKDLGVRPHHSALRRAELTEGQEGSGEGSVANSQGANGEKGRPPPRLLELCWSDSEEPRLEEGGRRTLSAVLNLRLQREQLGFLPTPTAHRGPGRGRGQGRGRRTSRGGPSAPP